jgi:phage terminase large subunit GpA-like protein
MLRDLTKFRVAPLATAARARTDVADILLPPPDIDVAESAELYRGLYNPQGYSGPWRHAIVPYVVEPMRSLTDPRYDMAVFVAPAQSAKTELGLNFAAHSIRVDPADFQIVLPEKQQAEDFSERRLGRMVTYSPELAARLVSSSKYASVFAQSIVNLSWPTSANASSKPVPRNWLDERDSMDDDIDGEGDPVALYHKRSQTFGPRRKTLVTSSPKRSKVKGAAKPVGRHEAPATKGVLALYNEGTRKQLYWPCKDCGAFFVTRMKDLLYADSARSDDPKIAVWFVCPDCGAIHGEEDRRDLWARHHWLAEGEAIAADGTVTGAPKVTSIDSFWLFGPQAAFITLEELVRKRLRAEEVREKTGSDTELRAFWNIDAGEVYESAGESESLQPDALRQVALDVPLGVVPAWGQLVVCSLDVQGDRFEIQAQALGAFDEAVIIDHQKIVAIDAAGKAITVGGGAGGAVLAGNRAACDPALEFSHWLALVEAVFDRVFPLAGHPGRGIVPHVVAIDTGGKAGVTDKAYKFSRWLKRHRPDLAKRAMFLKGKPGAMPVGVHLAQWDPRVLKGRAGTRAVDRTGVALWNVWVDGLKDTIDARLKAAVKSKGARGPGRLHLSRHLPAAVFEQVCAESRDDDGSWHNERKVSNEGWDCAVYCHAAAIASQITKVVWDNPPDWAIASKNAVDLAAGDATPSEIRVVLPKPAPPPNAVRLRQRGMRGQVRL